MPLRQPALDLPLDDHRIDDCPAVVNDDVVVSFTRPVLMSTLACTWHGSHRKRRPCRFQVDRSARPGEDQAPRRAAGPAHDGRPLASPPKAVRATGPGKHAIVAQLHFLR